MLLFGGTKYNTPQPHQRSGRKRQRNESRPTSGRSASVGRSGRDTAGSGRQQRINTSSRLRLWGGTVGPQPTHRCPDFSGASFCDDCTARKLIARLKSPSSPTQNNKTRSTHTDNCSSHSGTSSLAGSEVGGTCPPSPQQLAANTLAILLARLAHSPNAIHYAPHASSSTAVADSSASNRHAVSSKEASDTTRAIRKILVHQEFTRNNGAFVGKVVDTMEVNCVPDARCLLNQVLRTSQLSDLSPLMDQLLAILFVRFGKCASMLADVEALLKWAYILSLRGGDPTYHKLWQSVFARALGLLSNTRSSCVGAAPSTSTSTSSSSLSLSWRDGGSEQRAATTKQKTKSESDTDIDVSIYGSRNKVMKATQAMLFGFAGHSLANAQPVIGNLLTVAREHGSARALL
jgi:hypothetical protein